MNNQERKPAVPPSVQKWLHRAAEHRRAHQTTEFRDQKPAALIFAELDVALAYIDES